MKIKRDKRIQMCNNIHMTEHKLLTTPQKEKALRLLRHKDFYYVELLVADGVEVDVKVLRNSLKYDGEFRDQVNEVHKLWNQSMESSSFKKSMDAPASSTERMFLLKASNPEKYGDKVALTIKDSNVPADLEYLRKKLIERDKKDKGTEGNGRDGTKSEGPENKGR